MDAIVCLETRRSVRKFEPREVPMDLIRTIANCGRLAPTGRNEQPWEFVLVDDPARIEELIRIAPNARFLDHGGVALVVLAKDVKYILEDGSAATTAMLLAAHALGLGACWVAGHKKEYQHDVERFVGAPEGTALVAIIALGYPAARPSKPSKRSLDEVFHHDKLP